MISKKTSLLIVALTTSILVGQASLVFGQRLNLDTQIESPPRNNNAQTLPEKQPGDNIRFQFFAAGAAGRQIQGYTVELALKGKTFGSYIDRVSGADLNGAALISGASSSGNPTLSMLSLSAVTVPTGGYLGQIDLRVSRALTSSDVLAVQAASMAGPSGVSNLDVSRAKLTFTTAAQCPGDFNGDGMVNLSDFLAFAGVFGTRSGDANYDARIDMNSDGAIDLSDFLSFAGVFGKPCPNPPTRPPANTDREALVALYNTTNGENWTNRTNWLSDRPLGEWHGVTTDARGRVNSLNLIGNGLSGPITPELGNLPNLRRLELAGNNLSGVIPSKLGSLSSLQVLYLRNNQLSGPIPVELGNLPNLERLLLEGNQLSGEIPEELGNLSNLQELSLFGNQLSKTIPVKLNRLPNLERLFLHRNQLSGKIPAELGRLSKLKWLDLSYNQLSGEIPMELSRLSSLERMLLYSNQLSGPIPVELGRLSNLGSLGLSNNAGLSGPLPGSFTSLGNLANLRVDGTGLCAPTDAAFQAWLRGIENKRGVTDCASRNDGSDTPKIYWMDAGATNYAGKIQRANLDGSGIQDLVSGSNFPGDLSLDLSAGKMYWQEQGEIRRADLDGSGIQDLVLGVRGGIPSLALDLNAGKIYWMGYPTTNIAGRIQRANLDGSGVQDLVTGLGGIRNLSLDLSGGKMYWTEDESRGKFRIRRANLDGSGVQDLVSGLTHPRNLALNPGAGKIYWTEHETASSDAVDGKIQRANLDGSGVQDLVTGLDRPELIALDLNAGKIYWTEDGEFWTDRDGKIQRANLDGSGVQELVTGLDPTDLALDLNAGKIYWTDRGERQTDRDGKIQRANLNGTGVEDLVTGLVAPLGIALDDSGYREGTGEFHSTFEQPTRSETVVVDGIQVEAAENEVLVYLDEDVSSEEVRDTRAEILAQGGRVKSLNFDLRTIQAGITDEIVEQDFINAMSGRPGVSGAGVNEVVEPYKSFTTSNEQGYRQWLAWPANKRVLDVPPPSPVSFAGDFWIDQIDANSAWTALSDPGVMLVPNKIGIVDTGVPASQDVLNSSRISRYTEQGASLSGDDTTHPHGQNVTGYAAGYGNGPDRRGVNPHSDVVFVDVLRSGEPTYVTSLLQGIKAAIDQDAGVVNISWGPALAPDNASSVRQEVKQRWRKGYNGIAQYARRRDALLVWAAGNEWEKNDDRLLPLDGAGQIDVANTDSWLSHSLIVGASNVSRMDACFSSMGEVVNIMAPGEQVGFGTGTGNGTSYAAPMVAGAAGLVRAIESTISAEETRSILINSARNAISFNTDCGEPVASTPAGLLNLGSAIQSSLVADGVGLNIAGDVLLTRGRMQAVQINVTVPSGGVNAIDVGFVIDQSGSYGDDIQTLKARARDIVSSLGLRTDIDVQFGVAGFADFPQEPYGKSEDVPYRLYQRITSDPEALIAAINRLDNPLMDGNDHRESQYEALYRVAREIGWREGALRILLLATDAGFHNSDTEPGYPGMGRRTTLAKLEAENIILIGLQSGSDAEAADALQELADATGGSVLSLDAASSQIVDAIESGLDAALAEVDVTLEVLAGQSWVGSISPAIHQDVRGGRTVSFTVLLEGQRDPSIDDLPYNVYLWARGDGSALLSRTKIPIIVPRE